MKITTLVSCTSTCVNNQLATKKLDKSYSFKWMYFRKKKKKVLEHLISKPTLNYVQRNMTLNWTCTFGGLFNV